jgi:exopolyphosphatase / guanosine-5'-triphosphate,3'-diphosphate pyrophosphatase
MRDRARALSKRPRKKIATVAPKKEARAPVVDEPSPRVVAVIDVGSRSVRLGLGEIAKGKPIRKLESLNSTVALGMDTFASGRIRFSTTEALIDALNDFLLVTKGYGISPQDVRAVATTAVRDARNRDVFLDRVHQRCGLRIGVIEAIEETRLIYQFVRFLLGSRFDEGVCLLLSLGAGGTQVILQQDGEIVFGETHHFGLLQLWSARTDERMALRAAQSFLSKEVRAIDRVQNLSEASSLIVINKELYLLLKSLATAQQTEAGLELTRDELLRVYSELELLTIDEIYRNTDLDYSTAEMARMALEELKAFVDFTSVETMMIPGASMMDSLLLDERLRLESQGIHEWLEQQIISAALSLGRKYRFDEGHALQVQRLALQLYDALEGLTHLSPKSRLRLEVAALLHDIGYFVSFHYHEQHSSYLIMAAEILGLDRYDLERISLIARYHRRPLAALDRQALNAFPPLERVELLKLAALLRLADALDEDNLQSVEHLSIEISSDVLQIFVETKGRDRESFASIASRFKMKADLFEDIFGIEPKLIEVLAK